jgi:hypothetical protein
MSWVIDLWVGKPDKARQNRDAVVVECVSAGPRKKEKIVACLNLTHILIFVLFSLLFLIPPLLANAFVTVRRTYSHVSAFACPLIPLYGNVIFIA